MYSLENGLSETFSQDDEDVTTCVQGQSDVPGKSERFMESSVDPELLRVAKARISAAQMVFSLSCQMSLPSFCSFFLNWCCYQAAKSHPGDLAFSRFLARCEVLPCGSGGGSWNFDAVWSDVHLFLWCLGSGRNRCQMLPGMVFPCPAPPLPARNQHGIREAFPPDAPVPTWGDRQHSAGQRGHGHVLVAREGNGTDVLRLSSRVGRSACMVWGWWLRTLNILRRYERLRAACSQKIRVLCIIIIRFL